MIYYLTEGRIPHNLDLDVLITKIDGNITFRNKIKEGIVYFLSLLSFIDDYPDYWLVNDFLIINDARLAKIVGKGGNKSRTKIIKDLLESNGIVEVLPYRKGKKSTGFRFCNLYNSGVYINIPLHENILDNLLKHEYLEHKLFLDNFNKTNNHLSYNFDTNNFNILHDNLVHAIKEVVELGVEAIRNKRKFTTDSLRALFSYFGKHFKLLMKLENGEYGFSPSITNNRLYTTFNRSPKLFRKFIQVNHQDIGEVDIRSCQIYLLACIFNGSFSSSTSDEVKFNLKSIYPELYKTIQDLKYINPSRKPSNNHEFIGIFVNDAYKKLLEEFTNFDFATNDFYTHISNFAFKEYPNIFEKKINASSDSGRDIVKKNIMSYLFDDVEKHRDSNDIINLLVIKYKSIEYILTSFYSLYSKRDLALLLQRTEAYLILEEATRDIYHFDKNIPVFTIHDCIVTTTSNLANVKNIIEAKVSSITGKAVGLKVSIISGGKAFSESEINEILSKTIIKSSTQMKKVHRNTNNVNIEFAIEYLFKDSKKDSIYWRSLLLPSM